MFERFYQLDADYSRRAQFPELAHAQGAHAEPFEAIGELMRFARREGLVFVEDSGAQVQDLIHALAADGRYLPLVVYSVGAADPERVVDVLRLGALDYLQWPIAAAPLRRRLRLLRQIVAEAADQHSRRAAAARAIDALSPREAEVLALLAGGGSNKAIARELAISPRTVEIHRANMLDKLGTRTSAAAMALAIEANHVSACPLDEPEPSASAESKQAGRR